MTKGEKSREGQGKAEKERERREGREGKKFHVENERKDEVNKMKVNNLSKSKKYEHCMRKPVQTVY